MKTKIICLQHVALVLLVGCIAAHLAAGQSSLPDQLFAANRFERARDGYVSVIKQHPQQVEAHEGLIRTLIRLDQWQRALEEANTAVGLFPHDADARGLLSLCLMRAGMPARAQEEAMRALGLKPDSYWALVAVGRSQLWNYQLNDAHTTLQHAVKLHPDWPEARGLLADAAGDTVTEENLKDTIAYAALAPQGHPNDLVMETLPTRIKFMRHFLGDEPYHVVSPFTEAELVAADGGAARDVVFTAPIERKGDVVILPVELDNQKYRLLFDTGGGFEVTLDKQAANRLRLPILYRSSVRGVSGKEGAALIKANRLQIGEQVFQAIPVEAISNDVGPFDGIFGVTNLDHYAVTIDFANNKLTMARGKTAYAPPVQPGNRLVVLPFHYHGGDIFVPLTVEGRSVWAIVDTGAEAHTIFSLRLAREIAAHRAANAYREARVAGRIGIGTTETRQTLLAFKDPVAIQLDNNGGQPFRTNVTPGYGASPLDDLVSPSADFEVGALVGIEFLARASRMTIDYPHRVLTLEFPEEKPKSTPSP